MKTKVLFSIITRFTGIFGTKNCVGVTLSSLQLYNDNEVVAIKAISHRADKEENDINTNAIYIPIEDIPVLIEELKKFID